MFAEQLNKIYREEHSELRKSLMDSVKYGHLAFERLSEEEIDWLKSEGFRVDAHAFKCNDRGQQWIEWGWIVRWD